MVFLNFILSLEQSILTDIGLLIILATIIAFIAKLLKQPLIPAYILTGIILGPMVLGLIKDESLIRHVAELGIAFLLFVVGLEINLKKLKYVGAVATVGGVLQVIAVYLIGYYSALRLGFAQFESIILGLVVTFSSTMIVIKLLSDKGEIDTLHGKIVLGILIVQDIIVILALALIGTFGNFDPTIVVFALLKGLSLFVAAFLLGKFIFPKIFEFAARTNELLFLSSLTVMFGFSIFAYALDFSIAIGAFLGGLALAHLPYSVDIKGKVNPIKSFFATIFFVAIGMQLAPFSIQAMWKILLVLFSITMFVKPVILFITTTLFGYEKRTSFLTGLSLAQNSEFSLILVSLPFVLGLISKELFSLVIFLTVLTMALTSYLLEFKNAMYLIFSPILNLIEKIPIPLTKKLEYFQRSKHKEIVLIGRHRMGGMFYDTLKRMKKSMIVIDNNPDIIRKMVNREESCVYGDLSNPEVLEKTNLNKVKIIISTAPAEEDSLFLLSYVKKRNPKIKILVTAGHAYEADKLYKNGADYVILPNILSGEKVSLILRHSLKDKDYLKKMKEKHTKFLSKLDN
jgi:Kef-type K+ transport system membrane component KefB